MKQLFTLCCLALLLANTSHAQRAVSINAGYFGKLYDIGIEGSTEIKERQRVNFGIAYRFFAQSIGQKWGTVAISTTSNIQTCKLSASYDYFPFRANFDSSKNRSFFKKLTTEIKNSLKIRVGAQYIIAPTYQFTSVAKDSVSWGTLKFSQEQIGKVVTTVSSNKFQPLIALGIDRIYCGSKISVGGNFGVLYQGQPKVAMTATNMLAETASQAHIVESNIKPYQFLPFGELVVKYAF